MAEINKQWVGGETIWLDRLLALSEGFPPARDAVIGKLGFGVPRGRPQVDVEGWVRNKDVIAKMEQQVRERAGQIRSNRGGEDSSKKNYSWRFEATVVQGQEAKP